MLPRNGHQVVSIAENGRQLVQQCREHKPDLVISDVKMPEMDGVAAVTAVFRDRPVPVILVSAHQDGKSLGHVDHVMAFLSKPFSSADLEAAIKTALSRFRSLHASSNGDAEAR